MQEIFSGQKYQIYKDEDEGVFKLSIRNPTLGDAGKYSVEVNGILTSALLRVKGDNISNVKKYL